MLGASLYYNQEFFLPFIIFVIFAALLPDIDHNNSEISQLVPIVNKFFGHRQFTHSILGTVCFTLLAYTVFKPNQYITYALLLIGFIGIYYLHELLIQRANEVNALTESFFSRKQLVLFSNIVTVVMVILSLTAFLTVWQSVARDQIFVLLVIGYVSHIVTDWITKEGVPLFWPYKKFFGLKLFRTGGPFETLIGLVLVGVNIYLLYSFWQHWGLSHSEYWSRYINLI